MWSRTEHQRDRPRPSCRMTADDGHRPAAGDRGSSARYAPAGRRCRMALVGRARQTDHESRDCGCAVSALASISSRPQMARRTASTTTLRAVNYPTATQQGHGVTRCYPTTPCCSPNKPCPNGPLASPHRDPAAPRGSEATIRLGQRRPRTRVMAAPSCGRCGQPPRAGVGTSSRRPRRSAATNLTRRTASARSRG